MIEFQRSEKVFSLMTESSLYLIQILPSGHLAHLYYGAKIEGVIDYNRMNPTLPFDVGNSTVYSDATGPFSLNTIRLECPTYGKGDYREPMLHFRYEDGTRVSDFLYHCHEIIKGKPSVEGLPQVEVRQEIGVETLVITLIDSHVNTEIQLFYSVFPRIDAIVRRVRIKNKGMTRIEIQKALSMNIDFADSNFEMVSLDGSWIRERQITKRLLSPGITKIDSKKGSSSSDHNPFIALKRPHTDETLGEVYGFALIYSGNFEGIVEVNPYQMTRVQLGINSFDFQWNLPPGETFDTPEAILTFSNKGLNEMSHHFHQLVQTLLVPENWTFKPRPILINNWEATYFNFNENKLLKLAKKAKKLGIELFVLDDGWFGHRDDDTSSLGDYSIHSKKLPHGFESLYQKIHKIGMQLGIWVEPEMISPNSDLYKLHPDWAIKLPGRNPSLGRHQLILDLTRPEVKNYLLNSLRHLFQSVPFTYVKWDMNRNFSDLYSTFLDKTEQPGFAHRYVLNLYDILWTLVHEFPSILFESCSSGGNRFDLGMLYYMPQGWISDNSDAVERMKIQYGTSLVYPLSTMGCHVSAVPNHQTLRITPLDTRFNVAAFGLLGYELDLSQLSRVELKMIVNQIKMYKLYRSLFQYGTFYRLKNPFESNELMWMVVSPNQKEALLGHYQILQEPNYKIETYNLQGLLPTQKYKISVLRQSVHLHRLGGLASRVLPIKLKPFGTLFNFLANHFTLTTEIDEATLTGSQLLHEGWSPKVKFYGTGYNDKIRLLGDYGSRIYYLKSA